MFETEMMHQIWIYINIQIKYYNTNFHSDGLLDNDVREVSTFILEKEQIIWQGHFLSTP